MGLLGQRDPRWADKKLGNSNYTIGEDGCLVTSLAMVNNRFGANCTPDMIADRKDWFDSYGYLTLGNVELKNTVIDGREFTIDQAKIKEYLADFENKAMILELKLYHTDLAPSYHWTVAEQLEENGAFLEADPWMEQFNLNTLFGPVASILYLRRRMPPLP